MSVCDWTCRVDGERTGGDEQEALHLGLRLGSLRPAARLDLDDRLVIRRRTTGDRSVDDPCARIGPLREHRGDDVREDAARDHRVGLGDDGAVGQQIGLRGRPPRGV